MGHLSPGPSTVATGTATARTGVPVGATGPAEGAAGTVERAAGGVGVGLEGPVPLIGVARPEVVIGAAPLAATSPLVPLASGGRGRAAIKRVPFLTNRANDAQRRWDVLAVPEFVRLDCEVAPGCCRPAAVRSCTMSSASVRKGRSPTPGHQAHFGPARQRSQCLSRPDRWRGPTGPHPDRRTRRARPAAPVACLWAGRGARLWPVVVSTEHPAISRLDGPLVVR